ncbi:MAG: hypothetical protein HOP04_05685 [Methylophilaceae bacterium]|nr:hypothetical protein [Methylophilaceae bacterium]
MSDYRHYVSGFFPHKTDAESVLAKLVERELPRERLYIFDADSAPAIPASPANSKEVLGDVLVDSAIGTVVGTGLGALAEVVLIAANVSLFVASPLLAPLMMLGWGATVGALAGAAAGAGDTKQGWLSDLIRDAIANGQVVLVVETQTEDETAIAREIIQTAVGSFEDVNSTIPT